MFDVINLRHLFVQVNSILLTIDMMYILDVVIQLLSPMEDDCSTKSLTFLQILDYHFQSFTFLIDLFAAFPFNWLLLLDPDSRPALGRANRLVKIYKIYK